MHITGYVYCWFDCFLFVCFLWLDVAVAISGMAPDIIVLGSMAATSKQYQTLLF